MTSADDDELNPPGDPCKTRRATHSLVGVLLAGSLAWPPAVPPRTTWPLPGWARQPW